ncbi:MAG TPA: hypothetical protein VMV77_04265 [Bacteroidales bacterium]|nr:hypothetical protein [Bacteroidales bacterium]
MKKDNLKTLAEFKDEHYGKRGTAKRDKLEAGYDIFRLGALIQEARLENNVKEVRISTLQRIVELGLGGQIQLSIKL